MDAAFHKADRTTFVGSITPACTRFAYFPFSALNPSSDPISFTLATTMKLSSPALLAIH
jgi:hypothetical protein